MYFTSSYGFTLTKEDLESANEQKERKHYIDKEAVIKTHGTSLTHKQCNNVK